MTSLVLASIQGIDVVLVSIEGIGVISRLVALAVPQTSLEKCADDAGHAVENLATTLQ
jgi:hypothetical protein